VLPGGAGIRIGGAKPTAALCGQRLVRYPVGAMKIVLSEVAVIAKADTVLPPTDGAMVWIEPELPTRAR
jgi:GTP:adenosylcobinamide-phosphate guanylyltransferase